MDQPQTEDPLGNLTPKKPEKVVYVFNMSEDVWPFIGAISDNAARAHEIEENANLADRELFSLADENAAIFITPKAVDPDFLEYYKDVFNLRSVEILVPSSHTGQLCEDIVRDGAVVSALIAAANHVRKLTIVPYSTTPQFLSMVEFLKAKGITVYTPESPDVDNAWTVNFYGSKSGIRQLAQQSSAREPDLLVPDGMIVTGVNDAAKIAANKYIREDGVVIKTNKGHSGAGVLIFRPGDLPKEYAACEHSILTTLNKDAYWEKFPIVIEDLVNVNSAVAGGFPNVEFKILKSGKIEFLYYCGLRVTSSGVFKGIEINESIVTDRVAARIIDTGFFIGEQYAAAGYRGFFDVDFIAAKNGQIYVTESNVRRTGGTFVYHATLALIGKEFMTDSYVLSNNALKLDGARRSFSEIRDILRPVLFDRKTKEGVVIASANLLLQSQFAYIVFGKNEKRALELENEMERLIGGR